MTVHQDLIQCLIQSEFKGNRDRSQLILLMLYQRQSPRLAKAKVIIKRPKVQLPGHVKPISVPTQKHDDEGEEGPSHDPNASSSNDNSIPLPTTTPTSFVPGDLAQPAQQQSSQGTPELVSSQNDDDETEPYETDDTPVLTEEEIAQLQEEDVDTEPYTSDHSHFVEIDGTVVVPLGPKVQAAPDFVSYDVTGFNQLEQYLAKNGKKQPKAESVITQEVLRKYAKEVKQAKLEEFRSFLDFTAMTFRDRRDVIRLIIMSLADGCLPSKLIEGSLEVKLPTIWTDARSSAFDFTNQCRTRGHAVTQS